MEDGTLNGAMSEKMANKAMSLLQDGQYVRVQAGHVTNLEIPEEYTAILTDFPICSEARKQFYVQSIAYRLDNFLLPVYEKAIKTAKAL